MFYYCHIVFKKYYMKFDRFAIIPSVMMIKLILICTKNVLILSSINVLIFNSTYVFV